MNSGSCRGLCNLSKNRATVWSGAFGKSYVEDDAATTRFRIPDGRTKIMELPSIGGRLNYTRRSYSVTLYGSHACACTSLPRIRLTSGPRVERITRTLSRLSGRAWPYEQLPCLVFSYSLRFRRATRVHSTDLYIISYCRSKSPARSSKPSQSFRSATTLWRRGKYDSVVALNMSAVRLHMFSTPTEFRLVMQVAEQGPTDVP